MGSIDTSAFEKFLIVQKNLSDTTVKYHIQNLGVFLKSVGKKNIESADIQDFMLEIKKTKTSWTYKNYLSLLRILFRDYLKQPELIEGFKFPRQIIKPNILPSKGQLKIFFDSLPSLKYQIIFLMLASSGLRVSELLSADIDKSNRMLIPKSHNGQTKQAWISFYNIEAEALLKGYQSNSFETSRNTVAHVFKDVSGKTGINISAQTLRSVFAREMSRAGVQDRYVDAFCGRTPQSILARHYSDFSPEVLKEIYDKANLRYFG
ncbi:Tyrosine recombinase XerA [uncultured archaeon]|nr:Tyrosine recombinase XerA [uncultured archaeon]